ncbi:MAG: mercuric reductase [Deltaproteobacteria bacterium HGW-Deltaproteobacteria-15]|jgi:pyruvate/2-oxoglutarate dehydrogenase complex dihydrolipoamide dehydrogenase (E3) component|nr:MAG: mercuric reductase [Deltaproteobacteria bacterium HGW-Deltaproteobacteria-15]
MAKYEYDIGIIGGGAAGLTVASGAAQLGAKTLLVEKEKELGGDCLHFGCVPSKTLIRTARAYHAMKHSQALGLPIVEVPPVEFAKVRERIRSVIATIQTHDSEERFCSLGAKVQFGEPVFTDEHSIRLNGDSVSAKNWVIATGSSPDSPRIEGLDKTHHITNKEIFSLDRLPESMIILGAGPIAIEMAQAFCRLGTRVFVVQRSGQILSKEDKDMADEVMQVLASEGVGFHLNVSVLGVRDLGNEREVLIKAKDGETESLKAEQLLVAMGRDPNIQGLNLEGIGIEFDRKGVKVDDRMRTSRKRIYAAGDVTGRFQFTHAAGYEGSIVVSNAIFHLPRKADYTFLPWCTYTDPELASIGMNEKAAKEAGIEYSVFTEAFRDNDRSLAEGERVGKIKMVLDKGERVIGVQILGPHAGDLLSEWVAVLNGKVKLSTLASAVHPYPTLGEINKRVAGAYLSPKIFSNKVRKGLKFFFSLKGRACG